MLIRDTGCSSARWEKITASEEGMFLIDLRAGIFERLEVLPNLLQTDTNPLGHCLSSLRHFEQSDTENGLQNHKPGRNQLFPPGTPRVRADPEFDARFRGRR